MVKQGHYKQLRQAGTDAYRVFMADFSCVRFFLEAGRCKGQVANKFRDAAPRSPAIGQGSWRLGEDKRPAASDEEVC